MSVEPDKSAGCPTESDKSSIDCGDCIKTFDNAGTENKKPRSVRFPDENAIVTQYFEPANPWQNGKNTFQTIILVVTSNL